MKLDFEAKGALWNGNEGVVLFNLENVWSLQQNPINPYENISYNCVPITHKLSRGKEEKGWIYLISTSLTNQALDLEDLEKRSKVDVMLEKCFAISSNDASYKPKINIHKKRCNAKR